MGVASVFLGRPRDLGTGFGVLGSSSTLAFFGRPRPRFAGCSPASSVSSSGSGSGSFLGRPLLRVGGCGSSGSDSGSFVVLVVFFVFFVVVFVLDSLAVDVVVSFVVVAAARRDVLRVGTASGSGSDAFFLDAAVVFLFFCRPARC